MLAKRRCVVKDQQTCVEMALFRPAAGGSVK